MSPGSDNGRDTGAERDNRALTRRDVLRTGLFAGAGIGATTLLSACGGGSSSPARPAGSTTAAVGKQTRGGTLRVGLPQGGPSDTIDGVKGTVITDFARLNNLYDPLVTLDPTTFELKNLLAEEITPNATATEWTIRLRDGVEFHNGKT